MSFEINVTHLFEQDCSQYSNSVANSGLQNVGEITWNNSVDAATEKPLVSAEQQADLRDWIRGFGAWDKQEIAAMSDAETNALLLQYIAGDIQELEGLDLVENDAERERMSNEGTITGRLFKGENNEWWFYVGD